MENQEHIKEIIKRTFGALQDVYNTQKEGFNHNPEGKQSRLIFPRYSKNYRKGETRLSEQELRFIFVEQFNKYCEEKGLPWFFSVETPTEYKYIFSDKGKKIKPRQDVNGQSAMVDLAIHDENLKRIALIEFKALNPDQDCFTKDFVKLAEEPVVLSFFVMYVKSYKNRTINSLKSKIGAKDAKTIFVCYDLETGKQIENQI